MNLAVHPEATKISSKFSRQHEHDCEIGGLHQFPESSQQLHGDWQDKRCVLELR